MGRDQVVVGRGRVVGDRVAEGRDWAAGDRGRVAVAGRGRVAPGDRDRAAGPRVPA